VFARPFSSSTHAHIRHTKPFLAPQINALSCAAPRGTPWEDDMRAQCEVHRLHALSELQMAVSTPIRSAPAPHPLRVEPAGSIASCNEHPPDGRALRECCASAARVLRECCSLFVARAMVCGAAQCGAVERLRPQECSDCAAQERVHELNVDVLVALDGWTQGNKNKMLA
jgi:hypothetical protein